MNRSTKNYLYGAAALISGAVVGANTDYYDQTLRPAFERRIEGFEQPPEIQGQTQLTGRDLIGKATQFVWATTDRERGIDRSNAFIGTYAVKDIFNPDMAVMQRIATEESVIYTKFDANNDAIGFDVSEVEFAMRSPEIDADDGVVDGKCKTPTDSPRYRGCVVSVYMNNGWLQGIPLLGADNEEKSGIEAAFVDDVLQSDVYCLINTYYSPAMNKSLERFGDSVDTPTETIEYLARAGLRLSDYQDLGIPPQTIFSNFHGVFDDGGSVNTRLRNEATKQNINVDNFDVPDDFCALDGSGNEAVVGLAPNGFYSIGAIAVMGMPEVPAYYNPDIDIVDESNNFFAPISNDERSNVKEMLGL
jgi:hypothetical protein